VCTGSVFAGRVNGRLAVSRVFGQKKLKVPKTLVTVDPEIMTCHLRDDDEFVSLSLSLSLAKKGTFFPLGTTKHGVREVSSMCFIEVKR